MRALVQSRADEMREVRDRIRAGDVTREEARERVRSLRRESRDRAKEILTSEQWEKAQAFRAGRIAERVDERLARMDGQLERRAAFLGRVLGLDPDQAREVRTLIMNSAPQRRDLLGRVKTGGLDPQEAASQILDLEKDIATRIEALLTPEQARRLTAVRDLVPGGAFGMGPCR
jgi:Spy/CpxP family protein refolding chaperone